MPKFALVMLAIAIAFAGAFSTVEVKAQTQPISLTVERVDYVNVPANEIPAQETLLLPELWGMDVFLTVVNKKTNNPCADWVPPSDDPCGDPNNWTNWAFGVYVFRDFGFDCEVRVEYLWRTCLFDPNLTQHNIIGVTYRKCPSWMPDWLCRMTLPSRWRCERLDRWLNHSNPTIRQERHLAFYEDMYYKLAEITFLNAEKGSPRPVYCGDPLNKPVKTHHISGGCEAMCVQTYTHGDYSWTTVRTWACNDFSCCVKEIYICRDKATGKLIEDTKYSAHSMLSMADCAALGYPVSLRCVGAETNFRFPCEVSCDGVLRRKWAKSADYPLLNIHDTIALGKENVSASSEAEMFDIKPNPTSDFITASFTNKGSINKLEIFDINGNTWFEININAKDTEMKIEVSKFPAGVYYVVISGNNEYMGVKQFIKE